MQTTKTGIDYELERVNPNCRAARSGVTDLFIFTEGDPDSELLGKILENSREKFSRMEPSVPEALEMIYDKPEEQVNHIQKLGGETENRTENTTVMVPLTVRMVKDRGFEEFVLKTARSFGNRVIYAGTVNLEKEKEWFSFRIQHPNMRYARLTPDLAGFLKKEWKTVFCVPLPGDIQVPFVLKKLNAAAGRLTTTSIRNFVRYLANNTLHTDFVPTKEEIFGSLSGIPISGWREALDNLVGMAEAKNTLLDMIELQNYNNARKKCNLISGCCGIRAVISGNPGVGKSTLIKILANALQDIGIVKRYSYCNARDLVADHVGGSEKNLREILCTNDMLILDELSGLATIDDAFAKSIVNQLVYEMENRLDFHVVFAGYERDVSAFLALNPGLRSRIKTYISIADYGKDELVQIAFRILKNNGYVIDNEKEMESVLKQFVEELTQIPDFGNARALRVLVEDYLAVLKAKQYADTGILGMDVTKEQMQEAIDRFQNAQPKEARTGNPIGFVYN